MAKTLTTPSPTEAALTAASRQMSELRSRLESVRTDLDNACTATTKPPAAMALALLDGDDDDEPIFDVADLRRQERTITDAIGILESRLQTLDREVVGERYNARRGEHVRLVGDIADAVERLHDALSAEASFRRQFVTCHGRSAAAKPSFDGCPWLETLGTIKRNLFRRNQRARGFDVPEKGGR